MEGGVRGRWKFGVSCSGFGNLLSDEETSVVCLSLFPSALGYL